MRKAMEAEMKHGLEMIALLENDMKKKEAVIESIVSTLPIRTYMKMKRIMGMNKD